MLPRAAGLPRFCRLRRGSILGAFYDFWDDTLFHDTVMLVGRYDFW